MSKYTNSTLISYTKLSPNFSKRTKKIKKIIIHHVAGTLNVRQLGEVFAKKERKASSNYGIDSDGKIAMYVEECNRAWTSSNAQADHESITIECANDSLAPNWTVSEKAMEALIELCTDICKRNGIEKIEYTGDVNGNLMMHCYFAATECPGPYLKSMFPVIAKKVNARLSIKEGYDPRDKEIYNNLVGNEIEKPIEVHEYYKIKAGDTLSAIARKYGTTVSAIQKLNPGIIKNVNLIYPNVKIRIK